MLSVEVQPCLLIEQLLNKKWRIFGYYNSFPATCEQLAGCRRIWCYAERNYFFVQCVGLTFSGTKLMDGWWELTRYCANYLNASNHGFNAKSFWLRESKDWLSQYSTYNWNLIMPGSVCSCLPALFFNPAQDKDWQMIASNQSKVGKYSNSLYQWPPIPDIWCNVCASEMGKQSSLTKKAEAKVEELCKKAGQWKEQRGLLCFIFVIWRRLKAVTNGVLFAVAQY